MKNKPTDDKNNTSGRGGGGEREADKDGVKQQHAGAPKEIPGSAGRENRQRQGDAVKGNRRQQDKSQGT
jgi:hypothetical protein